MKKKSKRKLKYTGKADQATRDVLTKRFKEAIESGGRVKINYSSLARELKISSEATRKYFSGMSTPNFAIMSKMAELFGPDTIFFLLTGRYPKAMEVDADEREIVGLYRKASENLKLGVKISLGGKITSKKKD